MLILVAVSVSVALNGGLFNKATDAKDQTKEAVIREQLQDIVLGKLDVENSTIPADLGSITLDGVTYAISAAEGTPNAETGEKPITITLTASGKEPIDYDLKSYVKVGGVKGVDSGKNLETNEILWGVPYVIGDDDEFEAFVFQKSVDGIISAKRYNWDSDHGEYPIREFTNGFFANQEDITSGMTFQDMVIYYANQVLYLYDDGELSSVFIFDSTFANLSYRGDMFVANDELTLSNYFAQL